MNVRITAVGRRLFAARSSALSEAAARVAVAIPHAERALADARSLDEALASVTSVLRLVDEAIDFADAAS